MTKSIVVKIGTVLVVVVVFLFSTDLMIRNNSYYDISKYSFTWTWLFPTIGTLREFPIVDPVGQVLYNFRGYESNTLGMQEYQIEYVTKASYKETHDTSITYLEEMGYSLEKTNGVDCTWEMPSSVNGTTHYYKDSIRKNQSCLTFVITQGGHGLVYVKLFLMR